MNAWYARAGSRAQHIDLIRLLAALLIAAIALAGARFYEQFVGLLYPTRDWLFFRLLRIEGGVLVFNAAALCCGQLVLSRVFGLRQLPRLESAVLAMCVGVFGFAAAMFAAGLVGWFTPAFATALPVVMMLGGALPLARLLRPARTPPVASSVFVRIASGAGLLALFLLFLQTFTPDAINYDASWMHVKFAEDYARHGRLIPFPANYHGGLPHLASLLDTWAYLLPGLQVAERWMLILHLEFSIVLWTLAAIAATVQRMLGRYELRASWTAFFLFPGIFVYDSNLGGAADHVLAFFTLCIVLAMLRVIRGFQLGACAALAVTMAAALLTKYQAFYVIAPVGLIVGACWLREFARAAPDARRRLLLAPVVVAGVTCALLLPHFAKNWAFYHNPMYPLMQRVFTHSWPRVPDGAVLIDQLYTDASYVPPGHASEKLARALRLFVSFSFQPHYTFVSDQPVFGSLFTLLCPGLLVLLLLRGQRRLALVGFVGCVALLLWGYTYNVDRNLQTFMPVLACTVAGVVIESWRLGWLARVGIVPLVALQLVWGSDALVYSSRDRIAAAFNLMASGFDHHARQRFDGYRAGYRAIGEALPLDAKVLLHTSHVALGIDRDIIQDWAAYQGLVWYGNLHTPRELFDYYRSLGVTHLLDEGERRPAPSKQEDVLYQTFVRRYARSLRPIGGYRLYAMPDSAPPVEARFRVLCKGLTSYEDGLYPIERLATSEYLPGYLQAYKPPAEALTTANGKQLLQQADAIVCGSSGCGDLLAETASRPRLLVSYSGNFSIYLTR